MHKIEYEKAVITQATYDMRPDIKRATRMCVYERIFTYIRYYRWIGRHPNNLTSKLCTFKMTTSFTLKKKTVCCPFRPKLCSRRSDFPGVRVKKTLKKKRERIWCDSWLQLQPAIKHKLCNLDKHP